MNRELEDMKFCPECGNKLMDGAKFCPECGFKIDSSQEDPVLEETSNLTSEEYIQKTLYQSNEKGVEISPFKDEKKLVAAVNAIAKDVDPTTVIGTIDTSILSNGKAGAVFTGTHVYMKEAFRKAHVIPFEGMTSIDYKLDRRIDEKNKLKEIKMLKVFYEDETEIGVTSDDLTDNFPLELISKILDGVSSQVERVESKNQIFQLDSLGPTIISMYFRVIIAFLRKDSQGVTTKEYKELVTLMTKVKVSKEVADTIRSYRFAEKSEDLDALLPAFKKELEEAGVSHPVVFQALCMDIIAMDRENLADWESSDAIKNIINKLNVSEKLVEYKVKEIQQFERIYTEKVDDNTVKNMATELGALATGAGISVGALAITGAVTGWGASLSGGLLAITFGSGGALVGVAAVAAGAYGAYRGVKYFAGTGQLESYSIKQKALADKITSLKAANTYILDDFNYLMARINELTMKIVEHQQLSKTIVSKSGQLIKEKDNYIQELTNQLQGFVARGRSVAASGKMIEKDQEKMEIEQVLTALPEILDLDKVNELIESDINKVEYLNLLEMTYVANNEGKLILDEDQELEKLQVVLTVLTNIKYFQTAASSVAQGRAMAKRGFKSIKSLLNEER